MFFQVQAPSIALTISIISQTPTPNPSSFSARATLKTNCPNTLDNLNAYLSKLSFLNYSGQVLKDLDSIVEWVDYGNDYLFNVIGIKLTIYLFENTYKSDDTSL